jgi:hypothetical protein
VLNFTHFIYSVDLSLAGCLDDNLESLQKQIKDSFTTMQSIYEKEICGFTDIEEIKRVLDNMKKRNYLIEEIKIL